MAYKLYMAGTLMPITPSKVTVKINNQNKTMTLINGEEINILKAAGLSDVSFELVLPQVSYPFSNGGAQSAAYYLSLFERLKVSKTPFQFILNRQKPGGGMFHYTNLTVGLETYISTHAPLAGRDSKSVQITMHIFAITDKFQMLLHRMPPVRAFCSFLMQENHVDFGCEPPK